MGERFFFIGGRLAIDFANTTATPDGRGDGLARSNDVAGFLAEAQGHHVDLWPGGGRIEPGGRIALALAREFRSALRNALGAIATGNAVTAEWAGPVNRLLGAGQTRVQLLRRGGRWMVTERQDARGPLGALLPVARSAAALIAEGPEAPVRRCANPRCVLYFYDSSRSGRRRWCSMAVCGNRSKVAAWARRERQG